jgi:avermitilol synthase
VYYLPALTALRAAASDNIGAVNDILSVEKEVANNQWHNFVLLAEHHDGVDRESACQATNELASEFLRRALAARAVLPRQLDSLALTTEERAGTLLIADDYIGIMTSNYNYHLDTAVRRYEAPMARQAD